METFEDITVSRVSTATPGNSVSQIQLFEELYAHVYSDVDRARDIFRNSEIMNRHLAWDPRHEMTSSRALSVTDRVNRWETTTLQMGRLLINDLLSDVDRTNVSALTIASCTGYAAPGPDILLAKEFDLPATVARTFVGHMGCYAAFNALRVGIDRACSTRSGLSLVMCIEVCSAHLTTHDSIEQAVVHSLFGDAGGGVLLEQTDKAGVKIRAAHSLTLYETSDEMTWRVHEDAFHMNLAPTVPDHIAEHVQAFVGTLLQSHSLSLDDIAFWGVHPGGARILKEVGKALELSEMDLQWSRQVLAEYGNCSSATILVVLDRILKANPAPGAWCVIMAFGPGLTIEGLLLQL